jgi:hypothetical protein
MWTQVDFWTTYFWRYPPTLLPEKANGYQPWVAVDLRACLRESITPKKEKYGACRSRFGRGAQEELE